MHVNKFFSKNKFSNFLLFLRRTFRFCLYLYALIVSGFFCLTLTQTQVQAQAQPQAQTQSQTQSSPAVVVLTPSKPSQQTSSPQPQTPKKQPQVIQVQPRQTQNQAVQPQTQSQPPVPAAKSPSQQQQSSQIPQNQAITYSSTAPLPIDPQNISAAIKKTEDTINSMIAAKRMAGVAVAVVYRNQIIYLQGFGVRKLGEPARVDADTVFQLGSVSKPIAATLAAVLETKGYFHISDPVIQYLPDFTLNSKQPRNSLRIINVLDHTSGLTRGGFNNMIESFASHDELVASLQTVKTTYPVGRKYDYHNAMYSLIADIVEKTTHQAFPNALANFLLRPLNMTRTSATLDGLLSTENRASPHTGSKGGLLVVPQYSRGYYAVAPAGGINSTARDMANFLKAQMGGYPQVVNRQALTELQTPYTATNNLLAGVPGAAQRIKNPRYGLGWRIVDYVEQPFVFHGGWLKGFTNFIGFLPEQQLGIVILHNSDTKFSAKAAMKFFEVAMGLPEVADVPSSKKGKGKGKAASKAHKNKGSKSKSGKDSKTSGKSSAKATKGKSAKKATKATGKSASKKTGTAKSAKGTKKAKAKKKS